MRVSKSKMYGANYVKILHCERTKERPVNLLLFLKKFVL